MFHLYHLSWLLMLQLLLLRVLQCTVYLCIGHQDFLVKNTKLSKSTDHYLHQLSRTCSKHAHLLVQCLTILNLSNQSVKVWELVASCLRESSQQFYGHCIYHEKVTSHSITRFQQGQEIFKGQEFHFYNVRPGKGQKCYA